MRCPICKADNPEPISDCVQCGASLAVPRISEHLAVAEQRIQRSEYGMAQAELAAAQQAMVALDDAPDPLLEARRRWLQGLLYYYRGMSHEAQAEIAPAVTLLAGRRDGLQLRAECLNTLGNIALLQGEMAEALRCYEQGAKAVEHSNQPDLAAKLWTNMGNISYNEGRVFEALFRYHKAVHYAEVNNRPTTLVMCYQMLCAIYTLIGPLAKGVAYARRIIALTPHIENQNHLCQAYINAAVAYRHVGEFALAHQYLDTALEVATRSDNYLMMVDTKSKLARLHFEQGDLTACLAYATEVIADPAAPALAQKEMAGLLVQGYVQQGDFDEAAKYVDWLRDFSTNASRLKLGQEYLPLALYYAGRGDWPQAEQNFERAIEQSKQRGEAYELGQLYFEYAKAAAQQDEMISGRVAERLAQAAEVFRKIGATYSLAAIAEIEQQAYLSAS